jgi:hypothetical protein
MTKARYQPFRMSVKRDHRVDPFMDITPASYGSAAYYFWTCRTCGEKVESVGQRFQHEPRVVKN